MDYFSLLPREILSLILLHPDLQLYLLIFTFVCKRWHRIVQPNIDLKSKQNWIDLIYCQGDIHISRWIHQKFNFNEIVYKVAVKKDDGMLQRMSERRFAYKSFWSSSILVYIIQKGDVEAVGWLLVRGYPRNVDACVTAARHGHLPILQLLCGKTDINQNVYEAAAMGGHVEILDWLYQQKGKWKWDWKWTRKISSLAEEHGHPQILEWMKGKFLFI